MIKPLLRSIPTMSGNVKLACTLLDYNKISKDTFETNIRGAFLYPLSSQLFQKSVKVSLLNSSYEYDLQRFYGAYSDSFYSPCFEYDKKDITTLDRSNVVYTRNTDFEYGVKRISYQKSGCQFACFAPIYIDNVNDIPAYFLIKVNIHNSKQNITKYIRVNIGINGNSDYNYIYKYLKKYLSNIDDNVIYMDNTDKSLVYYGIDCLNGGFTKNVDATVKNLFNIHMPIQMFDRTISIGFERNQMAIRQVLPLAFYFNIQDILTNSEKVKLRFADIEFSGAYYDKNGRELKWYDFDWDYTKFSNDIYTMNKINGIMQPSNGYTSNIMEVGFPSLYDKYLTQYQFANKLTTTFSKWKLKYSTDEWPYITNMSWAFSNNQDSTYKYREFPVTFTNQSAYAIIDDRNKYNLRFPLGKDREVYDTFNIRSAKKYEAIMNNYCLNWFDLYYKNPYDILDIEDCIKRDSEEIDWSDVDNGYTYYKGVMYNFNLIYDKVSRFDENEKIDKFAVIVHPDTANIINEENKDKITFTSLSILTKELNNTEQILDNCIFNKQVLSNAGSTSDEYIPLFDIYDTRRTDNLLYNEIFDILEPEDIDTEFIEEPIFINSNDILLDIYKSNSVIKPSEYAGIYKLSTLKYIAPVKTRKNVTIHATDEFGDLMYDEDNNPIYITENREVTETYFGANFINALITLFNTYEYLIGNTVITGTINKIAVVPDSELFEVPTEEEQQDKLVYTYYDSDKISPIDKLNLIKISKRIFYSDKNGRTVLDLMSKVYDRVQEGAQTITTSKNIKVDLFNGTFPDIDDDTLLNNFLMYAYFAHGPEVEDISLNPNVSAVHRNIKLFNGKPEYLLLAVANVVAEAMKMYTTDEDFESCFPLIFNDFGYEMWELLPIFRGKLFTNIDGKVLTSLENIIHEYNDANNTQYDHIIKDIYINYNKYHSFNPEKLIYKSGSTIVVNEIENQDQLNETYGHTLYYKSKFIDDTFLDKESFTVNTKFFGPLCLVSDLFPLGDISTKSTGTNAIYHAFNKILQMIQGYLKNIINNSPINERFFYYPVKYYNNYSCGSNIAYKINENWNEFSNNVVYGETMDNNVLYVHPYNFSKIMHNAIIEKHDTIVINAFGELDDVYTYPTNNTINKTTQYYSGAVLEDGELVINSSEDITYLNNGVETSLNNTAETTKEYLNNTTVSTDVHKYERQTSLTNEDGSESDLSKYIKSQAIKTSVYEQKVNENTLSTEGMFDTVNPSNISISESDKVDIYAKVYDSTHLSILLDMKESDFECVTGFKEVTIENKNEEGEIISTDTSIEQIIDKIGNASNNRFYEQHKRIVVDINTGYIKVKYEYIPIDWDKKYIIPDINITEDVVQLNNKIIFLEDERNNIPFPENPDNQDDVLLYHELLEQIDNQINEIKEELTKFYSIISYKSMIIFDNSVGMFKRYKICDKHIKDEYHEHVLNNLFIKTPGIEPHFNKIYNHESGASYGTIPVDGFDHVKIENNSYVYEYFNIVEKNTFIKVNQSIKDYINIFELNGKPYNDLYIYRPILDMEYDEKYSVISKAEAVFKDLSQPNPLVTDTATMLYPCFNTIYKQAADTTLLQLNIAVDNIRDVKLIKPTDFPNSTSRTSIRLSDLPISDSYYRYVLKDNALFISVTKEEYEDLCTKTITFNTPVYDENGKLQYKYVIWKNTNGEDLSDIGKRPFMMYENLDESTTYYNYEDPDEYGKDQATFKIYERNPETGKADTSRDVVGLPYYLKGDPLFDSEDLTKKLPISFSSIYKRRYIPTPIYFSSKSNNEIYKSNNINTFKKDGLIYGYYLINSIIDNSSKTLNIRAMLDTNTAISSYSDIDSINNINYVSLINDIDITTVDGLQYFLYVFRQLCPFMYNNITSTMLSINTIMQPTTFNITNTYSTHKANTINGSTEMNLVFNKQTITTAKRQVLQRYTNKIVPYIYECSIIPNIYNLKYKECNATLLDTGNYPSLGDSVIYNRAQSINRYYPINVYGVSLTDTKSYNNIVSTFTPIEYKYYNGSKMLNLETYLEITANKRFTYAELLIAETEEATLEVFATYLKRIGLVLTNDEILFLYNKYEKKYETKFVDMSIDNSQKLYTLTYKFNLL